MKDTSLKKLKYINLAILVVIMAVLIIILTKGITGGGIFMFNYTDTLLKEEICSVENISDLSFSLTHESVKLFITDDENLRVVQYGAKNTDEKRFFKSERGDSSISVRTGDYNFYSFFNFSFKSPRIEVYLPEKYKENLNIRNSSGGITADYNINLKSFTGITSSGGIRMGDIIAEGDIKCESSSGRIRVGTLKFSAANLKTSSGGITMGDSEGTSLSCSSSSGGIRAGTLKLSEANFKTSSGGISIGFAETASLSCESSSGGIRTEDIISDKILLSTNSGGLTSQKIECISAKLNSTSGGINIASFTGGGQIFASSGGISILNGLFTENTNLETTSGAIKLELSEGNNIEFEGSTGSGVIKSSFELSYSSRDLKKAKGTLGNSPYVKLTASTGSGGIRIN